MEAYAGHQFLKSPHPTTPRLDFPRISHSLADGSNQLSEYVIPPPSSYPYPC